jgi:hypothetical protein
MNDPHPLNGLEKFIDYRRREIELKIARQRLRQVERYRERLVQHIKELEGQIKKKI